jgi:hypothetical protein
MSLTPLESESLAFAYQVRSYLSGRTISHFDFAELMDLVRKQIMHLENKKYGCSTGLHSGPCLCRAKKVA